jgi:hypothetical protein
VVKQKATRAKGLATKIQEKPMSTSTTHTQRVTDGGADGARKALEFFWNSVSRSARISPFQRSPLEVLLGRWSLDEGRRAAEAFLTPHAVDLGRRSSLDLNVLLEGV